MTEHDTMEAPALRDEVAEPGTLPVRRGLLLVVALVASLGGAAIYLLALTAEFRVSVIFGLLFTALGLAQVAAAAWVFARPTRHRLWLAVAAAGVVVLLWLLARVLGVFAPDPWLPVNSVIGFTDDLCVALEIIAGLLLAGHALFGRPTRRRRSARVLIGLASVPLIAVIALSMLVGVLGAGDGLSGAGFPAGTVAPQNLPAGTRSTVEYCRPNGNPLAMDLYTPPANASRPAPVALYVHGGGLLFGDRKTSGVGNTLADHDGALFTPLQQELNARGFVVAAIDYRLPPATAWPAQIEDAKCAVRFLRAHAAALGLDSNKIAVWGSSAGGLLASLLGLADRGAGFDSGQYPDQSSAVTAVVDMFSPADLTDLTGSESVMKALVWLTFGSSEQARRSASPLTYVHQGAPPFLILQGTADTENSPRQSENLAKALHTAGVPTTLIEVQGAQHSLATPNQTPTPGQLTTTIADFLTTTLHTRA